MTSMLKKTLIAGSVALMLGTAVDALAVDTLATEKDKVSYMVGMDVARGLTPVKDQIDIAIVIQGLQDSLKGGKTLMTEEESQKVRQEFVQKMQAQATAQQKEVADKNKAEGDKFLAANKSKAGVKTTASGLQYIVMTEGKGAKPADTDQVKVHYVGTLLDGTKFDSSIDRGTPAQFPLNGVIPGWTEALKLMNVGSKYKLFIPAALGYGDKGTPGAIGPNATLVFEVELIEIVK